MIPDYRNVHKTHNTGSPIDWKCDHCQVPLNEDNRSHISVKVVCMDWGIYQLCKECRQRFFGNCDDNLMLKYAYTIAKVNEE